MGWPPTPSSFSPFGASVTLLAAAPPGRDGSTAVSFPFDDNRDEKQKEGILEIIKSSDSGSEKAARHDETCLAQVADEEEGSEHNLRTLARSVLDFLSVLKGRAQEGRSELAQHNLQFRILDSGASMHATGVLRLLSEFTRAPGGSSAAVYHTRDGKDLRIAGAGSFSPIDADAIPFFLPVISCGSPGPQKLDVQLERVIAAFDNRKYIKEDLAIKGNLAAAFTKERVEICRTRFTIPKVHLVDGLKKNLISVSQLDKDHGLCCCFHSKICEVILADGTVVGGAILFDGGIDKWAVLPDDTRLLIVGTGTMQMDGFSIPKLHLVDGLRKNLISVSQLDKDQCPSRWSCCSSINKCEVILANGTVVGGAILLDSGIDKWAVLPDDTRLRIVGTGTLQTDRFSIPKVHLVDGLKKNLISVSQLHKDDGLCCCFHSKICEVILADGTVVGGAILLDDGTKYVSSRCHLNQKSEADKASHVNIYTYIWTMVHTYRNDGMYELRFLEVPAEPEEYKLKKNLISVSQLDKKGRSEHNHLDIILDSGASMHATGNLRLLSEFTRAPGGSSAAIYHTRDGRDLRIAGVGMIACDKFHLPHVHYVPELGSRFTLASVQLLAGCDYLVMFCGGWCYVKNRNNGSHVGRGRMHDEDGLYHLEYLRIPHFVVGGAN